MKTGVPPPLLTVREREVLRQVAAGCSNKEIARAMGLSANTVAVHLKNGYRKLNVRSRKEVLALYEARVFPGAAVASRRRAGAKHILALDQGTTSSRAVVFDRSGAIRSIAQKEIAQSYPRAGWVEHDGREIWSTQAGVAAEALAAAGLGPSDLAGIGIANQRETTLVWNRETEQPVYPAIVWQDRRTSDRCDRLKREGYTEWIRAKTGLIPDAYFSATKIRWILDHVKGARKLAEAGRLLFGTVDTWLAWNCTRGEAHVTDASNASRTMLYNIHTGAWDEELLALFDIPSAMLPQVRSSSEVYGVTCPPFFTEEVPIAGIAGDQQAALFGQRCVAPGLVKNTYGTGCFLMMNTGRKPIMSKRNLLTTVAWDLGGRIEYALEGSIFIGGAVVQWLRDELRLIRHAAEVEALARSVPDNGGVYLVPAFAGLGAPHWNPRARGTMVGLTRGSGAGHLARASLESIAYQTRDVLRAMSADARIPIRELRVDGGAAANELLMQFQADILGVPVSRSRTLEATALGAAYLAGLAVGFWSGRDQLDALWTEDRRFRPAMGRAQVRSLVAGWERALRAAQAWAG
mgnify:CR=1 FL=1